MKDQIYWQPYYGNPPGYENIRAPKVPEVQKEEGCNCSECRPDLLPCAWNGLVCPGPNRTSLA